MADMSEEQRKELMEKLKKMSPEELKEFQKKQCIFCQIIDGRVKGKKVYEDNKFLAILDINPAIQGHILVMPKEHYSIMPQIPDAEIKLMGKVVKKLSHTLLKAFKAKGTSVFIANGLVAGQRAQHFMAHIIPREDNDKIGLEIAQTDADEAELTQLSVTIQNKINKVMGIQKEVISAKKPKVNNAGEIIEGGEESDDAEDETGEEESGETEGADDDTDEDNAGDKKDDASLDDIAELFK